MFPLSIGAELQNLPVPAAISSPSWAVGSCSDGPWLTRRTSESGLTSNFSDSEDDDSEAADADTSAKPSDSENNSDPEHMIDPIHTERLKEELQTMKTSLTALGAVVMAFAENNNALATEMRTTKASVKSFTHKNNGPAGYRRSPAVERIDRTANEGFLLMKKVQAEQKLLVQALVNKSSPHPNVASSTNVASSDEVVMLILAAGILTDNTAFWDGAEGWQVMRPVHTDLFYPADQLAGQPSKQIV
ncbi:hypothetical protein FN846DRAFT_996652 [Sphaerosporella brunnea]|uniref:Uncharacterized protein n=1 Tax=Sphaerosporella brunnea TaxID=1250544 RepID=A0A5J5EJX8_9PEZI|nr:hypothetical protein FN846DRAFT_996652 [Sphaerosporella brunnea]